MENTTQAEKNCDVYELNAVSVRIAQNGFSVFSPESLNQGLNLFIQTIRVKRNENKKKTIAAIVSRIKKKPHDTTSSASAPPVRKDVNSGVPV
ncbi:hypothetical protein EVAR_100333_1 [Eumeta japonica]|uniref:Uncharacterized protein n=1 Tax=Eumeta variegata TaxID=151549 RepID=A0A4C2AB03_EUMVA|nr:hypothetical protein EVAR_100333_1 [Eumeta japonica]